MDSYLIDFDRYPTLKQIVQTSPPLRLNHYTSPAGLIGIVQDERLWASHFLYLNDKKELQHALDVVQSVIANIIHCQSF